MLSFTEYLKEKWEAEFVNDRLSYNTTRHQIYKNPSPKEIAEVVKDHAANGVGLVYGQDWYTWTNDDGMAYHQDISGSGLIPRKPYMEFRFETVGKGKGTIRSFYPDGGRGGSLTKKDRQEAIDTIHAIIKCKPLIRVIGPGIKLEDAFFGFDSRLTNADWKKVKI